MRRILLALSYSVLLLVSGSCYAMGKIPTMVFLTFTDNTPYSDMQTGSIMDNLLLDRLLETDSFDIVERSVAKDVLEIETQLNITNDGVDKAVENNDFSYIFGASENDLTIKEEGEGVSPETTRLIGKKHHADYILHGTIDYLGKDSRTIMLPLKHFQFGSSTPYLEAVATVRIIDAATGRIIWVKKEKGVSKDSLVKLQNIKVGTGLFNNQLFYEALDKISKNVVKALIKDLQSGKIILKTKGEM